MLKCDCHLKGKEKMQRIKEEMKETKMNVEKLIEKGCR